jgi:hypothetical protein
MRLGGPAYQEYPDGDEFFAAGSALDRKTNGQSG